MVLTVKFFKTIFMALFMFAMFAYALPQAPIAYHIPQEQDLVYITPNGIDPFPRETDAGRLVLPLTGLMQRTYDISGQKSEWILGTSILGNPDLDETHMGMGSITLRYPSKLAGLFTTRLGFDATTLGLNGENGILFEERKGVPVDTPLTDLTWERPAFSGNALRLDFRRLVTDSISLELGVSSHSTVDSKEYSYQNVTHSPFFALGRDSTQIPFGGRNIAMNSMHIQPILTWRFGFGSVFFKMNYLNLENADNTSHKVLLDSLDKAVRTFQTDPYIITIHTFGYGGGINIIPTKKLLLSTDFMYTDSEISEDSLPRIFKGTRTYKDTLGETITDTLYHDSTKYNDYQSFIGGVSLSYNTLLNPTIKFRYEFLNLDNDFDNINKKYQQDREIGYLQLSDTLMYKLIFRTQAGMQRNSSVTDFVDFAPAFSADVFAMLPYNLNINATYRHDNKFPDATQLKIDETGRIQFARENLKFEERNRFTADINWARREIFYGIGVRHESVDNLIKPRWVKWAHADTSNTLEDVFTLTNIDNVSSLDWILRAGFRLYNWRFYLERGQTLDRSFKLLDTPELYYKGSIHWQNRFVFDRLGVSVRVDFQWFQNRYDCTIGENNKPELEYLKHYLALDFEARMQILQFELYSRIENLNHSIYMPASGYTPEGIRFAYGIVWTFRN